MPYRVLRLNDTDGRSDPMWCYVDSELRFAMNDRNTYRTRNDAEAAAVRLNRMYPYCGYVVCGSPNAYRWDVIMADAIGGIRPPTVTAPDTDDEEDEDEEPELCEHCGYPEDECYGHQFYECENCGWGCGAPDCGDCVYYSDNYGGDLCDGCREHYDRSECGSPGERLRSCSSCNNGNVHLDELTERFVCDCEAARLVADKRPVTLAHPLPDTPTLEVA